MEKMHVHVHVCVQLHVHGRAKINNNAVCAHATLFRSHVMYMYILTCMNLMMKDVMTRLFKTCLADVHRTA